MQQQMQSQAAAQTPQERARWIVFLAVCLLCVGLVWVESASYPKATAPSGAIDAFDVLKRQLATGGLALLALMFFTYLPSRRWLIVTCWAGFIIFTAWMAAAAKFGVARHGTKAWLFMQPSELAKVFLIGVGAYLLSRRPVKSLLQSNALAFLFLVGLVGGLLVWQRDIGMLMVVAISSVALLFVAGAPVVELFALCAAGLAAMAWRLKHDPVRLARIIGWLWPVEHIRKEGYHVITSLIAIARGKVVGLLPAGSPDKWYALPYPATDSIFCVIAAESGLWGTALLLGLFGALVIFAMLAAHNATSESDRLAALGCGLLIGVQAAIHMGVAVNFLPPTGITLPFISAGGSSLIASAIAAGIIANVARRGRSPAAEYVFA